VYLTNFESLWGIGRLYWTEQGICRLVLPGGKFEKNPCRDGEEKNEPFDAVRQLRYYFEKKLDCFNLPLVVSGTDFQKKVWEGLRGIPYGERWSYSMLAEFIGEPRAIRAVGNANHANPIPIIIPCHRVVRADGTLGGYAFGTDIKGDLIRLEAC
jgi:methylated-DNA-[protein]-cysteine S-methyltransferase